MNFHNTKRRRFSFSRSNSYTPMQWLKFSAIFIAILIIFILFLLLIFADSLLGRMNYVSADHYGYLSQSEADAVYPLEESCTDDLPSELLSGVNTAEPTEAISAALDSFTEDMFDINEKDVINILLLGTDNRSDEFVRDNTDTMILMSLDTRRHTIKLTSFMRDSYVTVPGYGKRRLNSAFLLGGAELLFQTLEQNFDIKTDKYIRVNFKSFRKIIDFVGGIEIEVTDAEAKYMCSHKVYGIFPRYEAGAGTYTMSGAEALNYARCRDVGNDFGRTGRQRKVLIATASKLKSSNISALYNLAIKILPMVETNIPKAEIYPLITPVLSSIAGEIETLNVPVKGSWKNYKVKNSEVLSIDFETNKKAIMAHIYSTAKLDM